MSIFQLSKTALAKIAGTTTEHQIHTVNFYGTTSINDPKLFKFFDTRYDLLKDCYKFAKEVKLSHNFQFEGEKSETKQKLNDWLVANGKEIACASGGEFGILTAKVDESVASILANKYLKEIETSFREYFFKQNYNFDDKYWESKDGKKLLREAQKLKVGVEQIVALIRAGQITSFFRYEMFDVRDNWIALLQKLDSWYVFENILAEDRKLLLQELQDFKTLCDKALQTTLEQVSQFLHKNNELVDGDKNKISEANFLNAFVGQFFFVFDAKMKDLEISVCSGINLMLNKFLQNIGTELIEFASTMPKKATNLDIFGENSSDDLSETRELVKSAIWNVTNLKYQDTKLVENWVKNIQVAINGEEIKESGSNFAFRLSRPKSAPSYPTIDGRVQKWNALDCTSELLLENKENFDINKFGDFLMFRLVRLIENDYAYKVLSHLQAVSWAEVLEQSFELGLNLEKLKIRNCTVDFVYENGAKNNKLTSWSTKKPTAKKLETWLRNELSIESLQKKYIEFYIFTKIDFDSYKQKWTSQAKTWDNKILRNTTKRPKIKHTNQCDDVFDGVWLCLQKLEKHLLLDNDCNNYKVFDKMAFKKYQNLSQVVFESIFDYKTVALKKDNLSRLLMDKEIIIPFKISRMTTTAKSTLLFELDDNFEPTKNSYIDIYSAKVDSGKDIKVVDSLAIAKKELSKKDSIYSKIMVGFLNGSGDNCSERKINLVFDKEGNQLKRDDGSDKSYQTHTNWQLFEEVQNIKTFVSDPFRGDTETVGGTNPAGYPKLYFFLIPKQNVANLLLPVTTNDYYLLKYTPYHHLQNYLELETKLANAIELEDKISATKEILLLRARLRFYYRISSIELDLCQKVVLKNGNFGRELFVKAHMQFANPIRFEVNEENKSKKEYTKEEFEQKFDNILGIDLGEKHLVCASLISTNWKDLPSLKDIKWQTFLPSRNLVVGEAVDLNTDKAFEKFESLVKNYEKQQKQFGTVKENLKASKKNFTDKIIEQIVNQISTLCFQNKAIPVFENLETGFRGSKNQLSLYTEIYRQTVGKLIKLGAVLDFDFMKYNPANFSKGIAVVNPFMTSKTCSVCDFRPIRFNPKNPDLKGIIVLDNWQTKSEIEYKYGTDDESTNLLTITKIGNQVVIMQKGNRVDLSRKIFIKEKTNNLEITLQELLNKELIGQNGQNLKLGNDKKTLIQKYLLNPRQKQDQYCCPNCGNVQNPDYQASFNIAKKFAQSHQILD